MQLLLSFQNLASMWICLSGREIRQGLTISPSSSPWRNLARLAGGLAGSTVHDRHDKGRAARADTTVMWYDSCRHNRHVVEEPGQKGSEEGRAAWH
jgi:hypothetical protein